MYLEAINGDMPTEPIIINSLRDVAKRLEAIVDLIDKKAVELDYVIKKNAP